MIEKLLGSKSRSQAWRVTPKDAIKQIVEPIKPAAVSPAPAPAPVAQIKTMSVLERIEETLREEMNATVEATPSIIAPDAPVADHSPVADPEAVEPAEAVSICPTSETEEKEGIAVQSEDSMDSNVVPVEVNSVDLATAPGDSSNIEVRDVQVEDTIPSLPQTPVRVISEPDQVDKAVSVEITQLPLPEQLEQEWADEEAPVAVPAANAPSVRNDLQR